MSKVSIIVPVYKVEAYLEECVRSLAEQTYSDIEIWLIDDGSPDCCGEMCEAWAKKDDRIHVIHQENGGISAARNHGLQCATGEYILFVDSDDYVENNYVERLVRAIEEHDTDVAMCGYVSQWKQEGTPVRHLPAEPMVMEQRTLKQEFLVWLGAYVVAWNKLYKRAVFDKIRFKEDRIFEDMYFASDLLQITQKWYFIPDVLYHYRMRKSSIINTKREQLRKPMLEATNYLVNIFQEDEELSFLAKKLRLNQMLIFYAEQSKSERKEWKRTFHENKKDFYQNPYVDLKYRAKYDFISVFSLPYCRRMEKKRKERLAAYQYFE